MKFQNTSMTSSKTNRGYLLVTNGRFIFVVKSNVILTSTSIMAHKCL